MQSWTMNNTTEPVAGGGAVSIRAEYAVSEAGEIPVPRPTETDPQQGRPPGP